MEAVASADCGQPALDRPAGSLEGVSYERAEREFYERKVAVYERMLAEGTADPSVKTQLAEARARLAELTSEATP